jgi:hypothetical protein
VAEPPNSSPGDVCELRRHRLQGQVPSISSSSDQLNRILKITTMLRTPTLVNVGSTMIVRTPHDDI